MSNPLKRRSLTASMISSASLVAVLSALLAGCAGPPKYDPPKPDVPLAWKFEAPWSAAAPMDAADKGAWWERYNDPLLNGYQQLAITNSPTLTLASTRLAQARATLAVNAGAAYPQLSIGSRAQRLRTSANRPLTNPNANNFTTTNDDFSLTLNASYEIDLAGRVRSLVAAASASAEQAASDLENIRLLLSADIATAYFNARSTDIELDVLSRSIALQQRSLDLVNSRHELGAVSGLDVAQQRALLESTLAQVDTLKKQRSQYEHALATLTGTPAPSFTLPVDIRVMTPPDVPVGVPSDALQRRPDVASAERAMAAANANIGIAKAAAYPSIVLGPQYGQDARSFGKIFDAPSLLWSFGVSATEVIFDGGRIKANVDFAQAGYEATVASYRRTVLIAMQEAEDGITGLSSLERATAQSQRAVDAARVVLDMATSRYEGGASTYLDVITAQQSLLSAERQSAQLIGQRMATSVALVKALGGDWQQ
jgi:multidrug efflux system outer membrane protein